MISREWKSHILTFCKSKVIFWTIITLDITNKYVRFFIKANANQLLDLHLKGIYNIIYRLTTKTIITAAMMMTSNPTPTPINGALMLLSSRLPARNSICNQIKVNRFTHIFLVFTITKEKYKLLYIYVYSIIFISSLFCFELRFGLFFCFFSIIDKLARKTS